MTEPKGSTAKPRSRRRRRLGRLLLFLGAILVALFFAEVALRISGFTYFNPYIVDEHVGYALRPAAEGWWRREGLTYVKINSHGFHDREHSLAKPANTFRIAVIGDSFTEAFQVPLEKSYWYVMERKLQECQASGLKVEVLSFGISGFSTARELILLQERVWQYSPDVVVLQVTTGNDIRDNSRKLNAYPNQPLPYFVFQQGKLTLDDSLLTARNRTLMFRLQRSFLGRSFSWMQNHLRLLGLIYTAREAYQSSSPIPEGMRHLSNRSEAGLDSEVYAETANPEWDDAWRVTERLIVEMRDEVRAKGAKFLVVTGSMGVQVSPDPKVQQDFMYRLRIRNLFYPDQRVKALGEREGIEVLNLAPPFADYANRNHVFLHGSFETKGRGHWNELGHQLAGELIAQELCESENR